MDKQCDKNCIANLNGVCCVGECKGQIISRPSFFRGTAEQRKEFYEDVKKTFAEYFEYDESIFKDEED